MKKKLIWLFALILALSVGLLVACNNGNTNPDDGGEDTMQVQLNKTELTLDVLAREQLSAVIKDSDGAAVSGTIVWTSSDTSVATVDEGLVTAIAAGTSQITAAYGDYSAVCELTVEANGVRPQLLLSSQQLELKTGATSKITPSVRFKTSTLNDSQYGITYEYTASEGGVVSVSSDGTVTALKYGTATVTVKANWAQATAAGLDQNLTLTVQVSVSPNYTLTAVIAEGYSTDIYLQQATEKNVTYYNTTVIQVTAAEYKNEDITSDVVYKTSDDSIATVDDKGVVSVADTANEGDTVEVWVEYATQDEGVLTSEKITLNVKKAIVSKTLENEFIAEITATASLPVEELFGSADAAIVKVYDAEDTYKTNIYNASEGKYDNLYALGNRTWIIEGEKISYSVSVLAVTQIITTGKQFADLFNVAAAGNTKDCFSGYYILGNNIDVSADWEHVNKGYPSGDGYGLTGTLDGRGYTVNGLNLGSGGLFGAAASTSSLKNIAFTNVTVNAGTGGLGLMFGWYFYGKMENVYIGINEFSTQGSSASSSLGLFALPNDATSFKNVVVVNSAESSYSDEVKDRAQYGTLVATTNKGAWENTFVVSTLRLFGGSATGGDTGNSYAKSVQRFESMAALLADSYYTDHIIAFDSDIWDVTTLTFKSSAEYFTEEFEAIPDTIEMNVGNAYTITANANAFGIVLSESAIEEGIVLDNGKLEVTEFTSSANLTVTVSFGTSTKTVTLNIHNSITVENYTYVYNLPSGEDFVIEGSFPDDATTASLIVTGTDNTEITLAATVSGETFTVAKPAFTGNIPSGNVTLTAKIGDTTIGINGVKLVYAVTTADEFMSLANHLVLTGTDTYDGSILISEDIDLSGKLFNNVANHPLYRKTFNGEIDGGNHTLSNINMTGSNNGIFGGTLYGTVKNLIVKNATISTYAGIICYENYGTIEQCYVKGSITGSTGLTADSKPDNFGIGLLAGKYRNGSHVKNCIVELVTRADVLYAAGAFGKLGDGSANENSIFENCYAVAAPEFALMTYGTSRTMKDFTEANGNKNFADIFELFADETAAALAKTLGLSAPAIDTVTLSESELALSPNGSAVLKAAATTTDGEAIALNYVWTTSDDKVATVADGEVTAVAEGEATITVTYGEYTASCKVTVSTPSLENLVLTDFTYEYNGTTDFVVTGDFPSATEITAKITGTDGAAITLTGITVSDGTLTIPAEQFKVTTMPTKTVTMSLFFDGAEMVVEGAYLIYAVNTAAEFAALNTHLTSDYDGHIILGQDIEDAIQMTSSWAMRSKNFIGIFDGRLHHIKDVTFAANGSAVGLLGNLGAAGVIKNVIVDNAVVSHYSGVLCHLNYGTIENCYVKGSMPKDGLTTTNINIGAGLLVGRNYAGSKVSNCIVEVTSRGVLNGEEGTATIFMGAAFGNLAKAVNESSVFTNCYAVNADGFTLKPYTTAADFKSFDDANGNKNFDTLADLLADETAAALAATLGIS